MATENDTTLDRLLAALREDVRNKRDLGDRFERLVAAFLRSDPLYADKFSDVWLFNDWPDIPSTPPTSVWQEE